MRNPWVKKNPFMSMWLSGANTAAGSLRGQARRDAATAMTQVTSEVANFWVKALTPAYTAPRKKRR